MLSRNGDVGHTNIRVIRSSEGVVVFIGKTENVHTEELKFTPRESFENEIRTSIVRFSVFYDVICASFRREFERVLRFTEFTFKEFTKKHGTLRVLIRFRNFTTYPMLDTFYVNVFHRSHAFTRVHKRVETIS